MEQGQEAHLARILGQFSTDLRAKYEAGQAEHGGNLWEKPGMLENAIAEAIDLVVYLYTLKEQRDRATQAGQAGVRMRLDKPPVRLAR